MYYMNESVLTVRLEKPLIKAMEKDMSEFHYHTKSDFLREAIREKHLKLEEERRKDNMIDALKKLRGSLKPKRPKTWAEYRKIREEVGNAFFAKLDAKFGENTTTEKKPLQAPSP